MKPQDYFKGKNFMTPDAIEYGFAGGFAYELAEGRDFNRRTVYGVSLRDIDDGSRGDGELFRTLDEAREFIASLRQ